MRPLPESLAPYNYKSFFVGLVDRPGPERAFFWLDGSPYQHGSDVPWRTFHWRTGRFSHPYNVTRVYSDEMDDRDGRSMREIMTGVNMRPEVGLFFQRTLDQASKRYFSNVTRYRYFY